jgi:uncharacterized membrane protein YgcG
MTSPRPWICLAAFACGLALSSGCCKVRWSLGKICDSKCAALEADPPAPLGTISDPIWQKQEENAEASDFVVHEHEFIGNTPWLNQAGEEHVKKIAVRMPHAPFPVLVEPSSMSRRPGDEKSFPVHGNHDLDMERRQLIATALSKMGVTDAEDRVVVSPALTPGFEQFEAERAYIRGFSGWGGGFGGGGGGGGFGGGGFGGGMP